jgi:hypothetical protein
MTQSGALLRDFVATQHEQRAAIPTYKGSISYSITSSTILSPPASACTRTENRWPPVGKSTISASMESEVKAGKQNAVGDPRIPIEPLAYVRIESCSTEAPEIDEEVFHFPGPVG